MQDVLRMYVYVGMYVCVCMYVCIYVCTYVCILLYLLSMLHHPGVTPHTVIN